MPESAPDPSRDDPRLSRRQLVRLGLALPLPYLLAACGGSDESGAPAATTSPASGGTATTVGGNPGASLEPTPSCDDGGDPTPAQTEGPYFSPGSPERASLVDAGLPGTRLVVAGTVVSTACEPVRRALLDFWQADAQGEYDNEGFRLRGHQFSDDEGRYRLETVVPGLYPGRTRHIHVKVQAPNGPVLTTQLYFPGEAANSGDGIFRRQLVLRDTGQSGGARQTTFTFVVEAA
jgi:protocatechuate 3,4-dioxygenase beta subunit